MESLHSLGEWITNNESLLSGIAAILAVAGVVISPIVLMMRRRKDAQGTRITGPDGRSKTGEHDGEQSLAGDHGLTDVRSGSATANGEVAVASARPRRLSYQDLVRPSPYPVEFAQSDGLRIAYNVRGSGEPTVIFAPGIVSHLHVNSNLPGFRDTYEQLAQDQRVVTFDKRGQGLSDPSSGAPSLEERCNDIEAVMDACGTESAVILAVSEAGPMAMKFAHEHPDRVLGLVLVGTTASFMERDDYPIGIQESALNLLHQNWGKGTLRELFFPSLPMEILDAETYRAMERLLAPRPSIKALVEVLKGIDVRPLLIEIATPALVIHFTGDLTIPVRMGRDVAERLPNAEFLEVASTDHADLSQSPDAIAAVREFCRQFT